MALGYFENHTIYLPNVFQFSSISIADINVVTTFISNLRLGLKQKSEKTCTPADQTAFHFQTTTPRIPSCHLALVSSCLGAAAVKMAADTGRYRSAVSKNKDPSGLLISVIR